MATNTTKTNPETSTSNETSKRRRDVGSLMVEYLLELGRSQKRAGKATTAELAMAAGVPVQQAYSRLYWMAEREDPARVVSLGGKGASRVWRLAPRRKSEK